MSVSYLNAIVNKPPAPVHEQAEEFVRIIDADLVTTLQGLGGRTLCGTLWNSVVPGYVVPRRTPIQFASAGTILIENGFRCMEEIIERSGI